MRQSIARKTRRNPQCVADSSAQGGSYIEAVAIRGVLSTSRAKICYFSLDQTEAFLDLFARVEGKHILLSECPLG